MRLQLIVFMDLNVKKTSSPCKIKLSNLCLLHLSCHRLLANGGIKMVLFAVQLGENLFLSTLAFGRFV